jgi:dTDP-4-amino-4,6-dideoxy-D-glucose transaminase
VTAARRKAHRPSPKAPGPIPVTQPTMPPMAEFSRYLKEIWGSRTLTNVGPLHQRLEQALCEYLDVEHVSLFNNGTNALLAAAQALDLKGEVVTTPFSFVATAHSLAWNRATPVFADIDEATFGLSARSFGQAITPKTTGVMPVHCYGIPCDVDGIAKVAGEHGLKVVYDAAHAFGIKDRGRSVLRHGDLSVLSFHATKVFNTVEGGAVVSHDAAMKRRVDRLRNFGIVDEARVDEVGLNGKLSEMHAAFGLAQLRQLGPARRARGVLARRYRRALAGLPGLTLPRPPSQATENFSYFPVLVDPAFPLDRDGLQQHLKERGILARRYFFPLIPDMKAYARGSRTVGDLPVARRVAQQVLCLPLYAHMGKADQDRVIAAVLEAAG